MSDWHEGWLETLSDRDLNYLIERQKKIMKQIPKECVIKRRTEKIQLINRILDSRK